MSAELLQFAFLLQEIPETLPESPVPGGVAAFVRFLFHQPQWLQIGGAIAAVIIGLWLLVLLVARRKELWRWIRSRPTAFQTGLAAGIAAIVIVAAGFGAVSWDYVQHDNEFCTGCHVMDPAVSRFQDSEHAELNCHDCHRQSIFASTRQLYLWVVDRPEEIGEHAPVPNRVCGNCHLRGDADSTWQRILATAGHTVHLESDSSVLADLQCVRCHGQEVHRFVPADQTCGQADCHDPATTGVELGSMAGQTGLHCVACHEFTAPVSAGTGVDSLVNPLAPGRGQCLDCHEMEALFAEYDPAADPHDARCGACHNPHAQESPQAALRSCTDAGCHESPDTLTAFHRGLPTEVTENCAGCHAPHVWVREGEACGVCHTNIPGAVAGTAALPEAGWGAVHAGASFRHGLEAVDPPRSSSAWSGAETSRSGPVAEPARWMDGAGLPGHGPSPLGVVTMPSAGPPPALSASQQARLRHGDHVAVPCTDCHATRGETHGQVTVGPGDCSSCHHGSRGARVGCGGCHGAAELAGRRTVRAELQLAVWEEPRARRLPFDHREHDDLTCGTCHGGPSVERVTTACADCHEEHHRAEASCLGCHEEHREDAHTARVHTDGCTGSGCHADPSYFALERTRNFCLVCHQDQVDHEAGNRCTECHLVRSPPGSGSSDPGD